MAAVHSAGSSQGSDFAVELLNVSKTFAGPLGELVTAVDDVTMRIGDGEFFSMLGPSGCGKTTSLRMIGGFELPTAGDVLIHGKSQGRTPPFQRPVNTVFQSYALFPHMTIGENVAFGLQQDRVPRDQIAKRVQEALELVRLPGYEKRKPGQLSGGQQQRVALARALVKRPEVLLLDEPLGALDLKLRKEMQLELKKLQREVGITFVFVTHDQEEALTMSDRIAVMSQGKALQIGPPEEIYERPNCRFVADFIGDTNFLEAHAEGVENGIATLSLPNGTHLRAAPTEPVTAGTNVTVAVRPEKIELRKEGSPPNSSTENVLPGRVAQIVYIGTDTHYDIDLGGFDIRVREQNSYQGSSHLAAVGDSVVVAFDQSVARVLSQ